MFLGILRILGWKKPSQKKEIGRISAQMIGAGNSELVEKAIAQNDRASHLAIIEALLDGAKGIGRSPKDAMIWANTALERKRKVEIVEYVEEVIPEVIASDRFLVKKGYKRTLAKANGGHTEAQCVLGDVLLAEGQKSRKHVRFKLQQGRLHLKGKGASHYRQAMGWYRIAECAGVKAAGKKLSDIWMEIVTNCEHLDEEPGRPSGGPTNAKSVDRQESTKFQRSQKAATSAPDFATRRGIHTYTQRKSFTRGHVDVLGGLLPRRGSIGADVELLFDGSFPDRFGTTGSQVRYKTDGNLQVFYRKREAVGKYIWIGKFVDTYNLF